MYESLIEWCKFPVYIHRRTGYSIAGDEVFQEPVICKGYRVDEIKEIVDKTGSEYLSSTQVYFHPSAPVTSEDMLSFPNDTKPREIRKLGGYYDGNTGALDIIVIYL